MHYSVFIHGVENIKKLQHNLIEEIYDIKSADKGKEKIMWLTEEEFEECLCWTRHNIRTAWGAS